MEGSCDDSAVHSVQTHMVAETTNATDIAADTSEPDITYIKNVDIYSVTKALTTISICTDVQLSKEESLNMKVITGTEGNIMPLCIFHQLYLERIYKNGHPNKLSASQDLITYNRMASRK